MQLITDDKLTPRSIIFTIFAVLSIIAYPFMRRRIPFSRVLLQTVMDVAGRFKSTYIIACARFFPVSSCKLSSTV